MTWVAVDPDNTVEVASCPLMYVFTVDDNNVLAGAGAFILTVSRFPTAS